MSCNCSNKNFHDYECSLVPKCHHCNARIDLGHIVSHSFDCITHRKCEYCNIPETLPGTIHNIDCPKWNSPENQHRIRESRESFIRRRVERNSIIRERTIHVILPDFNNLHTNTTIECPICQDGCSNLKTKCGHFFHKNCLENWFKINQNCPMCREKNFY